MMEVTAPKDEATAASAAYGYASIANASGTIHQAKSSCNAAASADDASARLHEDLNNDDQAIVLGNTTRAFNTSDESNLHQAQQQSQETALAAPVDKNGELDEQFHHNGEDIMRDAATARVAFVVHMALFFFAGLLITAVILSIFVITKFGLLTFLLISLLGSVFFGLAWFVDKTLKDEKKLQPVRRRIRRWKALATAVVLQEVRNFQLDWNEHLLLTDGNADYDLYEDDDVPKDVMRSENLNPARQPAKPRKSRSVVFKLMVKPFLKRAKRRRKRKEAKSSATSTTPSSSYVPPDIA